MLGSVDEAIVSANAAAVSIRSSESHATTSETRQSGQSRIPVSGIALRSVDMTLSDIRQVFRVAGRS
jgi:hypothetical protein